jgi:hypothetical protein
MATPPDFSSGQILTSSAMNSVGLVACNFSDCWFWHFNRQRAKRVFNVDFDNYRIVLSNIDSKF